MPDALNLASDNVTGVSEEILDAVVRAARGSAAAYGADPVTARLDKLFAALFETEVSVFPLATGTAANSLALAVLTPPYGAIYCHQAAHIANDECNAPEFYTGGAKLVPLGGADGKIGGEALTAAIAGATPHGEHNAQPAALSLSQATELGGSYTPDEVGALAEIARRHGMGVHMDGARIANSVVHLGCSFADITWRAGVDALSFGATKNGAMGAEALLFFGGDGAARVPFLRKRGGHLLSKMRFVSAQLEAYLTDDLWRRNATHANAMAQKLAAGLRAIPGARVLHPVEANELFVELPRPVLAGLRDAGRNLPPWGDAEGTAVRLVTAFDTDGAELEAFIAAAQALA